MKPMVGKPLGVMSWQAGAVRLRMARIGSESFVAAYKAPLRTAAAGLHYK